MWLLYTRHFKFDGTLECRGTMGNNAGSCRTQHRRLPNLVSEDHPTLHGHRVYVYMHMHMYRHGARLCAAMRVITIISFCRFNNCPMLLTRPTDVFLQKNE
jgi:hypothetical protein